MEEEILSVCKFAIMALDNSSSNIAEKELIQTEACILLHRLVYKIENHEKV